MTARRIQHRKAPPAIMPAAADKIVSIAADVFSIEREMITGTNRTRRVFEARAALICVLHRVLGLSFPSIGALLGRPHSVVEYAYSQVAVLCMRSSDYSNRVELLRVHAVAATAVEPDQGVDPFVLLGRAYAQARRADPIRAAAVIAAFSAMFPLPIEPHAKPR